MESKHKSDYGQWKLSAGKFYGDAEANKGIHHIIFFMVGGKLPETTNVAC